MRRRTLAKGYMLIWIGCKRGVVFNLLACQHWTHRRMPWWWLYSKGWGIKGSRRTYLYRPAGRMSQGLYEHWVRVIAAALNSESYHSVGTRHNFPIAVIHVHQNFSARATVRCGLTDSFEIFLSYLSNCMVRSTIIARASDALPLAASVDDEQVWPCLVFGPSPANLRRVTRLRQNRLFKSINNNLNSSFDA